MKVLLIGASGLLGHNVLRELCAQGHSVAALVRHRGDVHLPPGPWHETIGTPLDYNDLATAAEGCAGIVNCAGTTDMSLLSLDDYRPVNRDLCSLLLRLAKERDIRHLVHVSTANTIGYGSAKQPADERAPMQEPFASSLYARSKAEGERLLLDEAARLPRHHIVVLNPGFIIGGHDHKRSSGQLLLAAYRRRVMLCPGGGKSFVSARAVAAAAVAALEGGQSGCRYLATGDNLSIRQLYEMQASLCGYRQLLITLPDWLLLLAGQAGDLLRLMRIRTQLSSSNVRQLMVSEHYDCSRAAAQLNMPYIDTRQALRDFFQWYAK